jgi:hypothetical protein
LTIPPCGAEPVGIDALRERVPDPLACSARGVLNFLIFGTFEQPNKLVKALGNVCDVAFELAESALGLRVCGHVCNSSSSRLPKLGGPADQLVPAAPLLGEWCCFQLVSREQTIVI